MHFIIKAIFFTTILLLPLSALSQQQAGVRCLNSQTGQWETKTGASCPAAILNNKFYIDPQTGLKLTVIDNFAFTSVDFKITTDNNNFNGGLVWRYINLDNHYGASVNLAKRTLEIYKITEGKRVVIKKGKLTSSKSTSIEFEVQNKGENIQLLNNGKVVLETKDTTFVNGKVGYWCEKNDNVRIRFGNII